MFVRAMARPLLATWFVYSGVDAMLDPRSHAARSAPVAQPALDAAGVNLSLRRVVQIHGAATVLAATTLALSKTPRTAGLLLAGLAGATVAASEPFWLERDPDLRAASREHFLKNLSLLGGALIAATAGKPRKKRREKRRR